MKLFETEKPTIKKYEPTAQSLYVKWDDDRGRRFDDVSDYIESARYVEFDYMNADCGKVHIWLSKDGIRWIEAFDNPPEEESI